MASASGRRRRRAGGPRQALGRVKRGRVNTTGQGPAAGRNNHVVSPGQAGEAVHQNNHVATAFNQPLGFSQRHFRHPRLIALGVIKGCRHNLRVYRTVHIRNLFGSFADQHHHHMDVGVVRADPVGYLLQNSRFARFRRRNNQPALAPAYGSQDIQEPGRQNLLAVSSLNRSRGKIGVSRSKTGRCLANSGSRPLTASTRSNP